MQRYTYLVWIYILVVFHEQSLALSGAANLADGSGDSPDDTPAITNATSTPTVPTDTPPQPTTTPTNSTTSTTVSTTKLTQPTTATTVPTTTPTKPTTTTTVSTTTPTKPTTTTTVPTTKTTQSTTSTTEPITTTIEPTTTTTEPITTTTDPLTTTTEPITTTTDPSTITTEPTTITTEPTNTVSTTESSIEEGFDYVVKDNKTGVPCIASNMSISLNIRYKTDTSSSAEKQLKVPEDAKVEGTCDSDSAVMSMTWTESLLAKRSNKIEDGMEETSNIVQLTFLKKGSKVSIDQIQAYIYLDEKNFPDAVEPSVSVETEKGLELFSTSASNAIHKCDIETKVNTSNADFAITDVYLLAFNKDNDLSHKTVENCVAKAGVNVAEAGVNVAAIVGGVIAGVIVVAVIGFIIWRRRRNTQVYKEPI